MCIIYKRLFIIKYLCEKKNNQGKGYILRLLGGIPFFTYK